ncbi:MAG: winged helix-turn-helix domain-containing protein [Gammaproteobacteria bacterium]|nr:winged helix-turn-helix domain-containing protein [Gammaproteobacteria bacterium]
MDIFRLGSWKVEQNKNLLTSDTGKEVRIEPLNMTLLCYFAQNPSNPINREKLIEDVWDNKVVTDHAVYKTINQLRKYLASDGDSQDYIKTVPKKGYALVAPIEQIVEVSPSEAINIKLESESANWLSKWFYKYPVLHTLGLLLVLALLSWNFGLNAWWSKNQQPVYSDISIINQIDGILHEAIPSPDEQWLAITNYGDSTSNNRDIYLLNLESQQTFLLTHGDFDYSKVAWSTSGTKLVASRRSSSEPISEDCSLVILELAENFEEVLEFKEVTKCSPLGSSAAYDDTNGVLYYNYTKSTVIPASIYSFTLSNGEIELLTNPGNAVWGDWTVRLSPEQDKLLYMRVYEEDNEVFLYDLKSRKEEHQFTYISYVDQLSWTPDGQGIIFHPNKNQVAIYSLEHGYSKTLLTKDNTIISSYNSPLSNAIYTISRNNDSEIIGLEISDPSLTSKILHSSKAMELSAVYANQSDAFVFASKRSGHWQLWLSKEGKVKQLTNNQSDLVIYTPKWSPSDNRITYNLGGKIYIYDFKTNESVMVYSEDDSYVQNPFWSVDGTSLYFSKVVKEVNQIFSLHLQTNKLKQVTTNGGYVGTLAPDNKTLFLVKDELQGLWRLDLTNLEEVKVNDIANTDAAQTIQSVAKGLYFTRGKNNIKSLYFVDFATLSTNKLLDLNNSNSVSGFSVNHTQERVLTDKMNISNASLSVYRPQK